MDRSYMKIKDNQMLESVTIKEAISIMDNIGHGFCICVDADHKVTGIMTDGDFRRGVLNDVDLNQPVKLIFNKDFISVNKGFKNKEIENIFTTTSVKIIPIIDFDGLLNDVVLKDRWDDKAKVAKVKRSIPYPVVIMAGGKGTRLAPFTKILPKPLLPLGDEPVIKVIMDKFNNSGINKFYITVNSKKQMIKGYFHDHESPYEIQFVDEDEPLGTAGSLWLIKKDINTDFFVINCDVILDIDYGEMVKFHNKGEYDLTLAASLRKYTIPYGVCKINDKGLLLSMEEKPEQYFLVNTGLYFLNNSVLDLINGDEFMHMTDIVNTLKNSGFKVGVHPVTEKSWLDVGQWEEYSATLKQLGL